MRRKYHHKKKHIVAKFLEYGFHLWILLFVANILIFYTFNLFGFAAESDNPKTEVTPTISVSVTEEVTPTVKKSALPVRLPTKKPNGPKISLAFVIPGIGSGGGTLQPSRTKRNVTVYLYATDVNSTDNKVKPIYSVRTTAEYDANKLSPTYTAFINPSIELGDTVKNGKYQIAFITEQSLRKLVKDREDAIGGQIVNLTVSDRTTSLPIQRVIMGDMAPSQGNNIMDIADYNVLVDCFGQTIDNCPDFKRADLNDDGAVDGIDYNIMAFGFKTLISLGFPPPALPTPKPTQVTKLSQIKVTPKVNPTAKLSPKPTPKKSSGNPAGAIFGFFFFLLILGGAGFFVATRTKFGKAFLATHPIPFLKQKVTDKDKTKPEGITGAAPEVGEETPPVDAPPAEASTETIAESTEIPIEQAEAAKNATPAEPAPAETPAVETPAAAPADGSIDKTYYVKNKSKDDKGTWVVLTDDAGPVDGLLPTGTIEDGFERIKGTMTEEKGKKYILISEVLPSE